MDVFFYADLIVKLVLSALGGLILAYGSYFLDFCFWKGNIFGNYLPWLAKKFVKRYEPDYYKVIKDVKNSSLDDELIERAQKYFWFKPLGGCVVCMHVWLAMISWTVICIYFQLEWYLFFAYLLPGSARLRKLVGATY